MARRLGALVIAVLSLGPTVAHAQDDDAPDDERRPSGDDYVPEDTTAKPLAAGPTTQLGVGLRIRNVFMPEGMIELFLEDVPSGVSQLGFGLQLVRRKGNFDITVGLDYHSVEPEEGLYLEKGDTPGVRGENPDEVEFEGLALVGLDVSFIWHQPFGDKFALRYGAGIGLGFVLGEIYQTDTNCAVMGDIDSCTMDPTAPREKQEDVPPVVPIVNVLLGGRFNVVEQLSLDFELGFRDLFYVGVGSTYFF